MSQQSLYRVNIGCGATPTPGFTNYDNSVSVRLAKHPQFADMLEKVGLLREGQAENVRSCREHGIQYADGRVAIPLPNASASVIYASHMLEHFFPDEARRFIREARRVLAPGGVLRLSVPDLGKIVAHYNNGGDADRMMEELKLYYCSERSRTLRGKLELIFLGDRSHKWMYDGRSLTKRLREEGFSDVRALPPGETTITDPGELNLREREDESLYVEAVK